MYPQPEHTPGHRDCPACHRLSTMDVSGLHNQLFSDASEVFREMKRHYVSERTRHDYMQYDHALRQFFGALRLDEIHIGHIREYQKWRSAKAGPTRVNHEVSFLVMLLKEADLWKGMAAQFRPLPIPRPKVGHALTPEEESKLFLVASTRKRWMVAYCCALLTVSTTAGASEIINLRLGDVDLRERLIFIREGTKNEYRVREVPLNDTAFWAASRLMERARKLGASKPDHFLLPHCGNKRKGIAKDLGRHMYGWRRAWVNLREAAGMPWLRFHDIRHSAITRLLSNPQVSERTVIDLAGHVNRAMLKRYSHIRRQEKAAAVLAVDSLKHQVVQAL